MWRRALQLVFILMVAFGIFVGMSVPSIASGPPWTPPFWVTLVQPYDSADKPTDLALPRRVAVSIWPSGVVSCSTDLATTGAGGVHLYLAKNNGVAEPTGQVGRLVLRTVNGVGFPSLEFGDLPADLEGEPSAQYRFTTWAGNVRVYAADVRTFYPHPVVPVGVAAPQAGDFLDARIQIVWPHDEQGHFAPVDSATRVDFGPSLFLAQGDGAIHRFEGQAQETSYTASGQVFPRWVFNDVPVHPGEVYNFLASASTDLKTASPYTTIWTHASVAQPDYATARLPPPCQE